MWGCGGGYKPGDNWRGKAAHAVVAKLVDNHLEWRIGEHPRIGSRKLADQWARLSHVLAVADGQAEVGADVTRTRVAPQKKSAPVVV
jgi:hypothetical protein